MHQIHTKIVQNPKVTRSVQHICPSSIQAVIKTYFDITVKPVLSGQSKRTQKLVFNTNYR